ncbi:MAG TPA: hypothetical protein VJ183_02500 [Chloroflexia bacterium]|nr:hypothetical protein [Chloroflexia bacterium]
MRYDPSRIEAVIMQLRELLDPIALMATIGKKTRYGRRRGPTPWHYTRELLTSYDRAEDTDKVIATFEAIGVADEVDAGVWLAEHMNRIP